MIFSQRWVPWSAFVENPLRRGRKLSAPEDARSGADLHQADLRRCNFRGADLRDADLSEARMNGCQLEGARISQDTKLPFPKFVAKAYGMTDSADEAVEKLE